LLQAVNPMTIATRLTQSTVSLFMLFFIGMIVLFTFSNG